MRRLTKDNIAITTVYSSRPWSWDFERKSYQAECFVVTRGIEVCALKFYEAYRSEAVGSVPP